MLGPFFHNPPATGEKGRKVAWVVVWSALVMGVAMMLLLVVLAPDVIL